MKFWRCSVVFSLILASFYSCNGFHSVLIRPSQLRLLQMKNKMSFSDILPSVSGQANQAAEFVARHSKPAMVSGLFDNMRSVAKSLHGPKLDAILMLVATSIVIPLFRFLKASPIVGFMIIGSLLGPAGLNFMSDIHVIDILGEMGIVFFLFEMGLELSLDKLKAMQRDVFGLGTAQFLLTTIAGAVVSRMFGLSNAAAITIGGSLALSSSAFVLQLLKDKNEMGTSHGKASLGILLLQDLAVVPLLVVIQILGRGESGVAAALFNAALKAATALTLMSVIGKNVLTPVFSLVAKAQSHEAFLSVIFSTVLLMSFITKGIGLSDTLGAFLAGLLLAETSYRYQIEADIAPFRGLLLGFFFMTVGFSLDLKMLLQQFPQVAGLVAALILGKAAIITLLTQLFGVPLGNAQQCGLLNSQAGEFAFVAFGLAEKLGIISIPLKKLLLTAVALSMAATPFLGDLGAFLASRLEYNTNLEHYTGHEADVSGALHSSEYVVVCGYGRVGKMVCDLLDQKLVRYVVIESDAKVAVEARHKGLPVFFGDIHRPDFLKHFHIGSAKACIVTLDDISDTNRAVVRLKKLYPDLNLVVRAKSAEHRARLDKLFGKDSFLLPASDSDMSDGVHAVAPDIAEDSILLSLPFGGAVLQQLGVPSSEADVLLENQRRLYVDSNRQEEEHNGNATMGLAEDFSH